MMKLTVRDAEFLDDRLMGGVSTYKPGSMIKELQEKVAESQEGSTATDVTTLRNDLNALIAKLKAAGLMEK